MNKKKIRTILVGFGIICIVTAITLAIIAYTNRDNSNSNSNPNPNPFKKEQNKTSDKDFTITAMNEEYLHVIFVRHPQSLQNQLKFTPWSDVGVSDLGRKQLLCLRNQTGHAITNFNYNIDYDILGDIRKKNYAVYISPLSRATFAGLVLEQSLVDVIKQTDPQLIFTTDFKHYVISKELQEDGYVPCEESSLYRNAIKSLLQKSVDYNKATEQFKEWFETKWPPHFKFNINNWFNRNRRNRHHSALNDLVYRFIPNVINSFLNLKDLDIESTYYIDHTTGQKKLKKCKGLKKEGRTEWMEKLITSKYNVILVGGHSLSLKSLINEFGSVDLDVQTKYDSVVSNLVDKNGAKGNTILNTQLVYLKINKSAPNIVDFQSIWTPPNYLSTF